MHKTRRSVEPLAETILQPINKAPALYVAIQLGDFVEAAYFPHVEAKRRPSTVRGYRQMWERYLKPRCGDLVMHDAETRAIQGILDTIARGFTCSADAGAHQALNRRDVPVCNHAGSPSNGHNQPSDVHRNDDNSGF